MTQSYSLDLRVRVAGFVEVGHSCRAAARHFGVSDSCAIKLMQRQRQFGSPAPARQGRPCGTGKLAPYEGSAQGLCNKPRHTGQTRNDTVKMLPVVWREHTIEHSKICTGSKP
jgi:transposase